MSEPSSRRSFLFGRQATADDHWSKFLAALRRDCRGPVTLVADYQARLNPLLLDDVIQARQLCQAHDVLMALEGVPLPELDQSKLVLWVQAGSAWGSVIPLGDTGRWRVDAGCPLAVAQAAGLLSDDWPGSITNVAQWFAQAYRGEPLALTQLADHLVSVDWMLPDGTIEVFGAFGTGDSQPLSSLSAQKRVPALFELAVNLDVQQASEGGRWPMRFHLDALMDPASINLAHGFVGHGGSLGWLVAATFNKRESPLRPVAADKETVWLADIDQAVKRIIDPDEVFLSLPD